MKNVLPETKQNRSRDSIPYGFILKLNWRTAIHENRRTLGISMDLYI